MPGQKISELPSLADTAIAGGDFLPIVDVSAGITKKITFADTQSAIRFPYRAAMILQASVLQTMCPEGTVVSDGKYSYVKSTGATAFDDFEDFLPFGESYVGHWGALGTDVATMSGGFILDEPDTNETSVIQAAMDWCLLNGRDLSGDPSKVYGIQSSLHWARTASLEPVGTPTLKNLNLCCIGGTWTSGDLTDPDAEQWTFGPPMLYVGKSSSGTGGGKFGMKVERISCNGNQIATTGIWFRGNSSALNISPRAYQCLDCQIRVGDAPNGTDNNCTDSVFYKAEAKEWLFSEDAGSGYNDLSLRTAVGFSQESADVIYTDATGSTAKHSLVLRGNFFNVAFIGGKFWNGPVRTETDSITAIISENANVYQFVGVRFDDGQVRVENFNGQFVGCRFIQYSFGHLRLVATEADTTAPDFVFVGNRLSNGSSATLETRGGTWGDFDGVCVGNYGQSNTYTIGGIGSPRFRVSGKNFGFGTTPSDRFHIAGEDTDSDSRIRIDRAYDGTLGGRITIRKARGSLASPTAVLSGDTLGNVLFSGYDGSGYQSSASIVAYAYEDHATGSTPGVVTIRTTTSGTTTLSDRVVIDQDGLEVIGKLNINGCEVGGDNITINDDAVGTIQAALIPAGGVFCMKCRGDTVAVIPEYTVDIAYSTYLTLEATKSTAFSGRGSSVNVLSDGTVLTGTTGTDGFITVSPQSNGNVLIENRTGSQRTFNIFAR